MDTLDEPSCLEVEVGVVLVGVVLVDTYQDDGVREEEGTCPYEEVGVALAPAVSLGACRDKEEGGVAGKGRQVGTCQPLEACVAVASFSAACTAA